MVSDGEMGNAITRGCGILGLISTWTRIGQLTIGDFDWFSHSEEGKCTLRPNANALIEKTKLKRLTCRQWWVVKMCCKHSLFFSLNSLMLMKNMAPQCQ